jgi:hypothetical protein
VAGPRRCDWIPRSARDYATISTSTIPIPRVFLTPRGRRFLAYGKQSLHNPERYFRAIQERVGTPDPVVMMYVNQAVGAFAAELHPASAVMLGCACERLILLLAEAVASSRHEPWGGRLTTNLSAASPVSISRFFEDVRGALLNYAKDGNFPSKLADALDRKPTPIFERARGLRNRAGHPTADEVTADEAEGGLLLSRSAARCRGSGSRAPRGPLGARAVHLEASCPAHRPGGRWCRHRPSAGADFPHLALR